MKNRFVTPGGEFVIRPTREEDCPLILSFIKELAEYEKMGDLVEATAETLRHSLFERGAARCVIGELEGEPVGFALYFYNFSTFVGKPGLYLEDLFVRPAHRGLGLGKLLLQYLANLAREEDCGRMEWFCLDWNAPSIAFYKKMGARPLDDWTVFRLDAQSLEGLAFPQ